MGSAASGILPIFKPGELCAFGNVMSTKQLGELLQLSPQRIRELVAEGVLPRRSEGHFDAWKCTQAYIGHLRRALERAQTGVKPRERYLQVKSEILELELAERRGTLIPVSLFGEELEKVVLVFKRELEQLPNVAPELENHSVRIIEEKLRVRSHRIMAAVARAGERAVPAQETKGPARSNGGEKEVNENGKEASGIG